MQPNRQSYPLHDLLRDLELQFKSIASQRNIQFHVHDAPFWIDTDPQWIRRIVQNFVSNALRYTAKGRVLLGVLRSSERPGHIRIGVWDTGPGLLKNSVLSFFRNLNGVDIPRLGVSKVWA